MKVQEPIRLLGFGVSGLVDKSTGIRAEQTWLFTDGQGHGRKEKLRRLDEAVDHLRDRFGNESLRRGGWQPCSENPRE